MVYGLGFRVQGFWFEVNTSGFSLRHMVENIWF